MVPGRPGASEHRGGEVSISVPFPEPTEPAGSRAEVLLRYLDVVAELATGSTGE
jgi:hypothetical protein